MIDIPPIDPDEVLLRRFSSKQNWFDPQTSQPPHPAAFGPMKQDTDGLSVIRARIRDLEQESTNGRPGEFFVAAIRVRDLPEELTVVPDTTPTPPWYPDGDVAHAVILELNYTSRKNPESRQTIERWMKAIVESPHLSVEGPFIVESYDPPARWRPSE